MLILHLKKVIWLSQFLWLLQASMLYLIVPESSRLYLYTILRVGNFVKGGQSTSDHQRKGIFKPHPLHFL